MAQCYSYTTPTPGVPGMTDEPLGSGGRSIDRDLKTLAGTIRRLKRAWPGKSFKVFSFTNFYDPKTFRQVHAHWA